MIFADKLILLRKKAGWSQEELAEQMNVTRQSVSKWEGAQSVPDLDKMIRLSELFGVSTDYLLKDEIEQAEHINSSNDIPSLKRVSMEEANAFLSVKSRTAKTIAYAAFLCILSPIALLMLGAISESTAGGLNEDIAGGIGMIILIIFVAIAAVMFISSGSKTAPFAYLEKEKFETEYGVSGMVKERKAKYKDLHTKNNIVGTCLCISALIPLFVGAIIDADNDLFLMAMLSFSFLIDDKRNFLSRNSIFYRYFTVLYFYNSLIRELDFFYNAFTHLSFFQIFLLTTLSLFFIHKHLNSEVRQKTPTRIL